MNDAYNTVERLRLVELGYKIVPNLSKICHLKKWNVDGTAEREMKEVALWPGRHPLWKATGLLMRDGVASIDVDVNDADGARAALQCINSVVPQVYASAPIRTNDENPKFMVFCRVDLADPDLFFKHISRVFYRPGEAGIKDAADHKIELFGGRRNYEGKSWQCGIYGPREHDAANNVTSRYVWDTGTPALHEIALVELPLITPEQLYAVVDAFEAWAAAAGWEAAPARNTNPSGAVYDITEATRFNTDRAGDNLTYAELCDAFVLNSALRCTTTFIPGRSGTLFKCRVGNENRHGCVAVFVHGDDAVHFPKELAPVEDWSQTLGKDMQELIAPALTAKAAALPDEEPPEPDYLSSLQDKVKWLLATRGYCEAEDRVVRLYALDLDCLTKPTAFANRYKSWFELPDGKRKKSVFATDAWELRPERVHLDGVRMRPDRPFPLYEESGRRYKNTYLRPRHAESGGDITPFLTFMQRFIPEPVERERLFDWMAHKQWKPEIPGTAIVLVADDDDDVREGRFGTGRGFFFRMVHQLYGEAYAKPQDFDILAGASGQHVYTDWMHGSVLITVDEAYSSATAHRRGERKSVYAVLRDILDPASKRRDFKVKYGRAFSGISFCSFIVATNQNDAIAIPASDRRLTVLRNGRVMTLEERNEFVAWLDDLANIGALSRWLAARDLTAFDMYTPLETAGKAEMAELALSEVEETLRDMMADETLGLVFTKKQLEGVIANDHRLNGTQWQGEFKEAWSRYCAGLKTPTGHPRRVRVDNTQRKLFCFRPNKRRVDAMPEAAQNREVEKWGAAGLRKALREVTGLSTESQEKDE